jgi:APA family basic amino acid/polyamine antiporter
VGRSDGGPLPRAVLVGFAIAGGAPLAAVGVSLASVAAVPPAELVPATAVGMALFLAPLAIWLGYSETVASSGGLYAFVRAAAGERVARWQGWIWTFAYVLYLPYTVTYIVYDLLPYVLPVRGAWPAVLELALPIGICLCVLFGSRAAIYALGILAVVQLAALAVLAWVVVRGPLHAPVLASVVAPSPSSWPAVVSGGGQIGLLLVCTSLVTFLGGEATDGGRDVRRALATGSAILMGAFLLAAATLAAGATPAVLGSSLPAVALARLFASTALGVAVGVVALAGIAALIVAEFVALTRLWRAMFGLPERTSAGILSALFVAADVASLAGPQRFYALTLTPSLIALFVSQIVVFAVYPLMPRVPVASRKPYTAWALAAIAVAWAVYGLVGAVNGSGLLGAG